MIIREASPNHWRGTRRHLPVRRTRRQVRAREIVILVAGAALLRSYSAAFRTTTHVHGMRVAVVTLPGKVNGNSCIAGDAERAALPRRQQPLPHYAALSQKLGFAAYLWEQRLQSESSSQPTAKQQR
ncbi:MAG: hypothetical protein DMG87_10130 [Acidobacteria bacterium]|nr:MAG: hypothetical protein DMG87_10130 [Acidobacteriota bacterium]